MARPSPRLPPVTMTLSTGTHQLAGGGELERRNEAQAGRHFVGGQGAAAGLQKLALDVLGLPARRARRSAIVEHDVGDHDGAR